MTRYAPAARPTLYFIGVTTSESSVMRVFPAWAEFLELDNAAIVGIDFPLRADRAAYREAVLFIRDDPMSLARHCRLPVVSNLNSGSLIINATGLGKDSPGSPLTDKAAVPMNGIVWDLNYRGDLIFLDQARAHESLRHLQIENGWTYFIYGWTQAIAEVFHIPLLTEGPRFDVLSRIATEASRG